MEGSDGGGKAGGGAVGRGGKVGCQVMEGGGARAHSSELVIALTHPWLLAVIHGHLSSFAGNGILAGIPWNSGGNQLAAASAILVSNSIGIPMESNGIYLPPPSPFLNAYHLPHSLLLFNFNVVE